MNSKKPFPTHPYYYKFTCKDGQMPFGNGCISNGKWMPEIKSLQPCVSGYHCLTPNGLIDWINVELYRVEIRGNWIWKDRGKVIVCESYRTHSRVKQWNEKNQRMLAAEFAQWAIDRYWTNKSDTRPQDAIQAARDYAKGIISQDQMNTAGSAVWSAAESAAGSAARSAAESAAWSVASSAAWSAAQSAASSAAESAAWSAAWSVAWSVAESAGRSALNTIMIEFLKNHE